MKKYRWVVGILLAAVFVIVPGSNPVAASAEIVWMQTARADFEAGTLSQLDASGSPGNVSLGTSSVDYLYAFRGNNQEAFWKFDIVSNDWTSLSGAPDRIKWGGSLAYDGGDCIFAFRGNGSCDFWKYTISSDTWMSVSSAPGAVKEGGALYYIDGFIYALRGNDTRDFWRYNIDVDNWDVLANADARVYLGGAIIGDGGNFIYAFWGRDSDAFRRYDITSDTWELMSDAPAVVSGGGALAYDDDRYIYALCGGLRPYFWRYDTFTDSWSSMSFLPGFSDWGGSLAFLPGGYVYALPGACSQHLWCYDIAADTWEWRTGAPSVVWDGGALIRGKSTYYGSGSLVSGVYNTGTNADLGTVSWTASVPSGTEIKFQIAANSDNATWDFLGPDGTPDTFYISSGSSVWDGHDGSRYLKYKAFFSTLDTSVTPVLHDVAITWSPCLTLPVVEAGDVISVGETAVVLSGKVENDGGEVCRFRFVYGTAPGRYTEATPWTGSVASGDVFRADIPGLNKGVTYYFTPQLQNSVGAAAGPVVSLLTRPDPPVTGSFKAKTVNTTRIYLSWTKGEGAGRTMVMRSTEGYPVDINDGVRVYFDTGDSFTDTDLLPETEYFYRAWSETGGETGWSSGSQTADAITVLPVAVGGVVFRADKAMVLAPWLGLGFVLLSGVGLLIKRFAGNRR